MNRLILFFILLLVPSIVVAGQVSVSSVDDLRRVISTVDKSTEKATILIEPGTYNLSKPLVLNQPGIRILGINRDSVILDGGGMKNGISQIFVIEASDVTIENLTLGWVHNHGIQIRGENGVSRTVIKNIHFFDCYEQMLKISTNKKTPEKVSTGGLVEDCLFEYSAGIGPQWYIGGIDAHNAHNWVVRRSTFKNIRSPEKRLAEYSIHFWSGSSGALVEDNNIINCDRGIGFGLGKSSHQGGIIRNNRVSTVRDVGIGLESATGVQVLNNRVETVNYPNSIEYRFPVSRNIVIKGNDVSGAIVSRDGGMATIE